MSGIIAIVGRPNVGKSALFNRLVGRRIAIVHDQPGVTRDRISAEAEWNGVPFTLIDTGGIGLLRREKSADVIVRAAVQQVELAIEAAGIILFVVDVREGLQPLDREVAARLRSSGKTVLVVANKSDTDRAQANAVEFAALGFASVFPVSAIHNEGIGALMDVVLAHLPKPEASVSDGSDESLRVGQGLGAGAPLKLAIVGRPNVGKSSILNALTRSERVIVSPVPGTTRDSVDVPFDVDTDGVRQHYLLIDTAGIRKERRVTDSVEAFSIQRAEESIRRSDITLLVLDAEAGILEQDKKVADKIVEARRACIVVINKWDLVAEGVRTAREEAAGQRDARSARHGGEKSLTTLAEFGQWVQEKLFFLDYAPVIFTSATDGFNLNRLLEAVRYVASQLQQKIPTAVLNRTLHDAVEYRQPVSASGHRLKFYYATQIRQAPPTFLLFVNRADLFTPPYEKYLAGQLRRAFGYEGCPVVLVPRARPQTERASAGASARTRHKRGPRASASPRRDARGRRRGRR